MCDMAVDLEAIGDRFEIDVGSNFSDALAALDPLRDIGNLQIDGYRIRITDKGRPFARVVASAFDAYLKRNHTRHSPAI